MVLLQKPLVHIGEQPADICMVTPLPTVAAYAGDIARELEMSVCIALCKLDYEMALTLELVATENPKLIITRGHPAHMLRTMTQVPILTMDYSAENFLETLLPWQNSGMLVGHICFPGQGLRFGKVASLLGLRSYRLEITNLGELDKALETSRRVGIDFIVGGQGMMRRVTGKGFKGVPLLCEGPDVIRQVFMDAKSFLDMEQMNEGRIRFVKTVLDISPGIIIYADEFLNIAYANDSAKNVFMPLCARLADTSLPTLFQGLDWEAFCNEYFANHGPGLLKDRLGREFLVELTPVNSLKNARGYILSLSSVLDLRKSERKLRKSRQKKSARPRYTFADILGESAAIKKAKSLASRFAATPAPVLLTGETGTGKEMFAQAIHWMSNRRKEAFISFNCASLSETLLESELFGYEEGAFTSARRGGKMGLLEVADKGTIFLDEIGEMPLGVQARLLRFLQDQMVNRVGGTDFIEVDVRIICATNRDIFAMVGSGAFRRDLFYRINTLMLPLPPLAARREDIPLIVKKFCERSGITLGAGVIEKLYRHPWPGNVRELLHVLERAATLAAGSLLAVDDIVFDMDILRSNWPAASDPRPAIQKSRCGNILQDSDAQVLQEALARNEWRREPTARELGVSRTTLWKRMKKCGLA